MSLSFIQQIEKNILLYGAIPAVLTESQETWAWTWVDTTGGCGSSVLMDGGVDKANRSITKKIVESL